MARDNSTMIRVLLWIAPGMQRSIVSAALREDPSILVLGAEGPSCDGAEDQYVASLRVAIHQWLPDVVVMSAGAAEIGRLTRGLEETRAVFVSNDGRSALAFENNVSGNSLASMVRSMASHDRTS